MYLVFSEFTSKPMCLLASNHTVITLLLLTLVLLCFSHGKTTLLRHIASRAFAIPPNIDILYCEQEVVADDTPAVEEVLKADVKRTALLAECKKLETEQENGNMEVQSRLKEVRGLPRLLLYYINFLVENLVSRIRPSVG